MSDRKTGQVTGGNTITAGWGNGIRDEAEGSARLLAFGDTNALKVFVSPGLVYFGKDTVVDFAGGSSDLFADPTLSSRIDLVSMEASGVLKITAGVEDDSPSAPTAPDVEIPICEVFIRKSATQIDDTDQGGGDGYISRDIRPTVIDFGSATRLIARVKLSSTSTLLIDIEDIDSGYEAFILKYYAIGESNSATSKLEMVFNNGGSIYNSQYLEINGATITGKQIAQDFAGLIFGDVDADRIASGECIIFKPLSTKKASITGSSREDTDTTIRLVSYAMEWENTADRISRITVYVSGEALEVGSFAVLEGIKAS